MKRTLYSNFSANTHPLPDQISQREPSDLQAYNQKGNYENFHINIYSTMNPGQSMWK